MDEGGNERASRRLDLLSVVAPMYDEVEVAEEFYRRVTGALEGLPLEIVISDNASVRARPSFAFRSW